MVADEQALIVDSLLTPSISRKEEAGATDAPEATVEKDTIKNSVTLLPHSLKKLFHALTVVAAILIIASPEILA